MVHPFFDELRTEGTRMPNGREFPRLFNFTREGAVGSPVLARAASHAEKFYVDRNL